MNRGKKIYQYFIKKLVGPCSGSVLIPGMSLAPCARAKNFKPAGGFVCGSKVGIVIPGLAVSYDAVDLKVGASSKGDKSAHLGARGDTRGV
jgi:hypothetical protein